MAIVIHRLWDTVTVEIEARTRNGFEAGLQRTIKENCGC
jgi:hypothetical protein